MWKKPYFLAGVISGISVGIMLLLLLLEGLFDIRIRGVGLMIPGVVSYTIGQVYASKYEQPMSHQLKLWTLIYYIIILVIWTSFLIIIQHLLEPILSIFENIFIILLSVVFNILISLIMYWLMGQGCKKYLENMKR